MASKEIIYKNNSYQLSYELANPSEQDVFLVLHGWGSSKEIMKQAFGQTLKMYKHIYLDMPGFGKSSNNSILTTKDYAQIVKLFLMELRVSPKIIMGHSFGGKVSVLLDSPCLVLLSSSGVLVPKPWNVRIKIALFKLLKPLGIQKLRQIFVSDDAKGMNHEMYETFKNVVNEDFEANFAKTQSKTLLFWGKKDTATPLWTAEKIKSLIPKSSLYPLEGDHFFFLKHGTFIAQTIETQCKETHL
ncbi:MAG TPA: 2-hydroxy-6-oxohepta-2,4-dienoate hydrolase [Sulfurovum sp. UBA12169]|nr:MAG TPA: 2-hydroxy-6-oxohepta-2,4-dienoate hydrolase [Sulfurovum sp. UBA12169]